MATTAESEDQVGSTWIHHCAPCDAIINRERFLQHVSRNVSGNWPTFCRNVKQYKGTINGTLHMADNALSVIVDGNLEVLDRSKFIDAEAVVAVEQVEQRRTLLAATCPELTGNDCPIAEVRVRKMQGTPWRLVALGFTNMEESLYLA